MNSLSLNHVDTVRTAPPSHSERAIPSADRAREALRFADLVKREKKTRLADDPPDAPFAATAFPPLAAPDNACGPRRCANLDGADTVQAADETAPSYTLATLAMGAGQAATATAVAAAPAAGPASAADAALSAARGDFDMLAQAIVRNERPPGTHELRVMFRSTVLAGAVAQVTSSPSLVNVLIAAPVTSRNWLELNQRQLSEDLERRLGRHVVVRVEQIVAAAEVAR
jgi:hypothetical protein